MSKINFYKIQATGNDFVVVDYSSVLQEIYNPENIQKICDRHFGIGADGLIALEKSDDYVFRFHYYNSDGSRAEMCGNGVRAAMCFAQNKSWISGKEPFQFIADDGVHQGQIFSEGFKANILVNDSAKEISLNNLSLPGWIKKGYVLNTGVPHLVLLCDDNLEEKEIYATGKYLRFNDMFMPNGTNVNFVEIVGESKIYIRTYERGVENETLSCGTGMTAAAIVVKSFNNFSNDVEIKTNGGNLRITFDNENIYIYGPSEIAFSGNIEI